MGNIIDKYQIHYKEKNQKDMSKHIDHSMSIVPLYKQNSIPDHYNENKSHTSGYHNHHLEQPAQAQL